MSTSAGLRGYLLEEALAWLLRNSGYNLLTGSAQDPDELVMKHGALHVMGRGTDHQVDVLGEFTLTPAFSLPIRMFLEAKYYRTPCELRVVRNAHGVIHDINEHFVTGDDSPARRRYRYVYSLFSASGFTGPAQAYAMAQQISLVDLSGESFKWLRDLVSDAAQKLVTESLQYRIDRFPVSGMRRRLREQIGTASSSQNLGDQVDGALALSQNAPKFNAASAVVIDSFAASLRARERTELLLGFPAAPFILTLNSDDATRFIGYANKRRTHEVRLRRTGSGPQAEWSVTPWRAPDAYELRFNLPEHIESWIASNEERRLGRTLTVKQKFLTEIVIYRRIGTDLRTYRLRYKPVELHR